MRRWCNEYALILGFQALVMAAASAHPWYSDSLQYVRSARALAAGEYVPTLSHYNVALGMLVPMAAAFKILGYSPWAARIGAVALRCAAYFEPRRRMMRVMRGRPASGPPYLPP